MEYTVNILLFTGFETLDVFGPVEVFGKVEGLDLRYFSQTGGIVSNNDGIEIITQSTDEIKQEKKTILFIPGGMGTRKEIDNKPFIGLIRKIAEQSTLVLTICTGSALLAKTGLLDGKKATSNKRAFDWVKTSSDRTEWIKDARWVKDGKYYTSAGISAGIDMALAFIADIKGKNTALQIAERMEYNWNENQPIYK